MTGSGAGQAAARAAGPTPRGQTHRATTRPELGRAKTRDAAKRLAGWSAVVLTRTFGARQAHPLGIILYHRITSKLSGVPAPAANVTPQRFRTQITALLERGYSFWPLQRALDRASTGAAVPDRTVVLTFDDGFESVYLHAWPVLRDLGVPATLFVATAFLDGRDPFPFDAWGRAFQCRVPRHAYGPLTTKHCDEMVASGLIQLGSHTHTHKDFRRRPDLFADDLARSIDVLRSRFGLTHVPFAYPFGRSYAGFAGGDLEAAARLSGVLCALTTEARPVDPRSDPFTWGRFNVYDWDNGATLAAKLAGWYGWAPRLQERLTRRVPAEGA